MNCPACDNHITRVRKTEPYETFVVRERYCTGCNTVFTTGETIDTVHVFNPRTKKNEHIPHRDFEEQGWRDVVLNKKPHPAQIKMEF